MIRFIQPEETYFVRKEVLRKNIDLPHQFDGDFDKETFHLGAFDNNNNIVGVATFMKRSSKSVNTNFIQYQLRGMATVEEVRGKGFGKDLLLFAFEELKKKKASILWCNAREVALKFYQSKGFTIISDPFAIDLIGKHYVLSKKL